MLSLRFVENGQRLYIENEIVRSPRRDQRHITRDRKNGKRTEQNEAICHSSVPKFPGSRFYSPKSRRFNLPGGPEIMASQERNQMGLMRTVCGAQQPVNSLHQNHDPYMAVLVSVFGPRSLSYQRPETKLTNPQPGFQSFSGSIRRGIFV